MCLEDFLFSREKKYQRLGSPCSQVSVYLASLSPPLCVQMISGPMLDMLSEELKEDMIHELGKILPEGEHP